MLFAILAIIGTTLHSVTGIIATLLIVASSMVTGMGSGEYVVGCWDLDDAGYTDQECGGDDCDDTDPEVNPQVCEHRTTRTCDGGIDNDCDGQADTDSECTCFVGSMM